MQSSADSAKIAKVLKEFKEGSLHSTSTNGPRVKPRQQAIAIALSEQRKAGGGTMNLSKSK